jgi:dynein heavy chain, axonemal
MKDGKKYIKLGDQIIEYSSNFKFYITAKEKNPHYLPEILSKVTLINATTTFESVNNQLLDIIVSMERP